MPKEKTGKSLSDSLQEINAIIEWFETEAEVDVEKGLEQVKKGAVLIKESRSRLKEIENEFEVVKKELEKG